MNNISVLLRRKKKLDIKNKVKIKIAALQNMELRYGRKCT